MKEKYRYEAPEGGWGLLICLGVSIPFTTGLGSLPSFGILFGEFFTSVGAETSGISMVTSTYFLSLSTAGLIAGSLFKRFGLRRVALYAGFINTLGAFLQIFVRSTLDLVVAFGLLQGIGFGLIVPAFYTIFNDYFVKKRIFFMGFAQVVFGLMVMIYPVIIQALMEKYGFRGTLVILCAINANTICGMQVFHPVKWHMRKVLIKDHHENELGEISEQTQALNKTDSKQQQVDSDASQENSPLMTEGGKSLNVKNSIKKKLPKTACQKVADLLDLHLLKFPRYVNITFGITFALYSDIAFFTLQTMYLFQLGFTKQITSRIVAIGAAADLISRLVLSFLAMFFKTSPRNLFLAGAIFSIISRVAFLEVHDYMGVTCMTAVMGFFRTWIHIPIALVFADYLPKERFPTGYGLYLCIQGYTAFAFGPIIGYLRDVTKSYIVTFHVLNAIMGLCVITWILEYAYLKFIKKQKINI